MHSQRLFRRCILVAALTLVSSLGPGAAIAAERLGGYPVDPEKVSISGISSGAFMANQFHIAHSALIMGAGMVAGGLYACAVDGIDGNEPRAFVTLATGPCTIWPGGLRDVEAYQELVEKFAERGWIDSLEGLKGDRVYLFTGSADAVVHSETVRHAAQLYEALGVPKKDIEFLDHSLPGKGAGHSWVTESYGVPCAANEDPYINACGYDQAGDILGHIYGELKPRSESLSGTFVEFSQAEFAPNDDPTPHGLSAVGYLYAPEACAPGSGAACALHVVLHGCRQSAEILGGEFYKNIGVNQWADSNGIIVLYPQARAVSVEDFRRPRFTDTLETNPQGCWNWFGYAYDERYALKDGVQISAIHDMIRRILGQDQ
jgi:poly(3-hydroxybutyrate) depolymerase